MILKRFSLYLILSLHVLYASAFSPKFNKLDSRNGISQSEIYCFLQDHSDFIWFGTVQGLNRFDGYSITTYNIGTGEDDSMLRNNTILSLAEDESKRIWIGTNDGLSAFDTEKEKFHNLEINYRGNKLVVTTLVIDDKHLWIGTSDGLYIADISYDDIESVQNSIHHIEMGKFEGNREKRIRTLKPMNDGTMLVTYGPQLLCVKYDEVSSMLRVQSVLWDSGYISSFVKDIHGNIWFGTQDGLYRKYLNGHIEKCNFAKGTPVTALTCDLEGNLWIGTIESGLFRVKNEELNSKEPKADQYQRDVFDKCSLSSDMIYSLYVSPGGILWVGTIGSGVCYLDLNQKQFDRYVLRSKDLSAITTNFVRAISSDSEGNILAGFINGGLYTINPITGECFKNGFGRQSVFDLCNFSDSEYFICTSHNLLQYNLKTKKFREILASPCFYILPTPNHIFWCCSMNGLYRIGTNGSEVVSIDKINIFTQPALSHTNCRICLYDEKRNELWVGEEGGFDRIFLDANCFPKKIISYSLTQSPYKISNKYVRALCMENDSTIWVGTFNGLNRISLGKGEKVEIHSFFESDGLPDNAVQSIQKDDEGYLWIGTNGGLSKLITDNMFFWNFSYEDGIQSNEFSEHASYKAPDGKIYMGGIDGITSFYPKNIVPCNDCSKINITGLSVLNKKVIPDVETNGHIILSKAAQMTESIRLRPEENSLRLNFSSMNYCSAEKIRFRYRLIGYENEWYIINAKNREASYTNLPYGEYKFEVQSTDSDGRWEPDTASLSILIETPFYLTAKAKIIYFIIGFLIIYLFIRFWIRWDTAKKEKELKEDHMLRLHQLDMVRTRFFINISHDLRTPLTLIISPLEKIIKGRISNEQEKDNLIRRAFNSAQKLHYLIEQLLDFRVVEAGKEKLHLNRVWINDWLRKEAEYFSPSIKEKGLELRYNMPKDDIEVVMDCRKMSKVIFNLLSNAVKFTNEGYIEIGVFYKNEQITIEIADTGVGIEKEKLQTIFERFYTKDENSYGIGLSHCKDLLDAMSAECNVNSILGKGTTFYITLMNQALDQVEVLNQDDSQKMITDDVNQAVKVQVDIDPDLKTVLVVDDNYEMREYIVECLSGHYNVEQASRAADAFAIAQKGMIDLILSDVMMPEIDGIKFCSMLKKEINTSDLPVILLTAKTDPQTQISGLEGGADDYISKPFSEDILIARIDNLLQNRELLKESFKKNGTLDLPNVTVTSADEKFINNLLAIINDNIGDCDLTMEEIEEKMCMSHSNFFRKVKRLTGFSGKELLQNMRMKRAMQLIKDTDLRFNEISDMVGFADYKYFAKCFRENFGHSPSSFR